MSILQRISQLFKIAYIKNIGKGKWRVFSEKGKNLGTYDSEEKAKKRLKQIEFFKHVKASKEIDLTGIKEISYSSVMRELRKQCDDATIKDFLATFKKIFDDLIISEEKNPAEKAMPATLLLFSKKYDVALND